MNRELEQLLEAECDGRLDEAGRRRLDELCAREPAAAELRRRDLRLGAMMARLGPNHAPRNLAAAVFERLDSPSPQSAEDSAAGALWERLTGWWRVPRVRWAMGAALALLVVGEAAIVLRPDGQEASRSGDRRMAANVVEPVPTPFVPVINSTTDDRHQRSGEARPRRGDESPQAVAETQIAAAPKPSAAVTPRATAPSADGLILAAQSTPDALPVSPQVGLKVVVAKLEQAGALPGAGDSVTRQPGMHGQTETAAAQPHQNVTLKAIEAALAEAGGRIDSRQWVNGRDVWEIQTAMTADQLANFTRTLEQLGVKSNLTPGKPAEDNFESYYKITDGSQWLDSFRQQGGGHVESRQKTDSSRQEVKLMLTVDFVMFGEGNSYRIP